MGRRNWCSGQYDEKVGVLTFDIRVEEAQGIGKTIGYIPFVQAFEKLQTNPTYVQLSCTIPTARLGLLNIWWRISMHYIKAYLNETDVEYKLV
jgi:hypothetical protein